jgi:ribosomal protein S18 acetylase RimI-like enzyme
MHIAEASTNQDFALVRTLFHEYADSIGIDLSFQGFEEELAGLPGKYAPPLGGLFIAFEAGVPVGCMALRPLDPPRIAELKRLYVRPQGRGTGIGLALTQKAIERAGHAGYKAIRLDTLATMTDAQRLYRKLGFKEIPPYTFNPMPNAVYMELELGEGA